MLRRAGAEQHDLDWVNQKLDLPKRRLGVDTLDLVQMYWNDYGQKRYVDADAVLDGGETRGAIGAVGLTNFDTKRMAEMIDAGAEISSNQIRRFSLLDRRRPERVMVEYCTKNGVALLPYDGSSGVTRRADAPSLPGRGRRFGHELQRLAVRAPCSGTRAGTRGSGLLGALRAIGDKHGGVSVANVAARWTLQSPRRAGGDPRRARSARHVDDHRALFSFELDDSDLARIRDVLDRGKKPKEDCYQWERGAGGRGDRRSYWHARR